MGRLCHPCRGLIAAFAAALLVYLVAGHAQHPGKTMDEAAMGAGICIVLVTVVAAVAVTRPRLCVAVAPQILALLTAAPVVPLQAMRARASPVWLQRFLA